jgi:hypothetical protein
MEMRVEDVLARSLTVSKEEVDSLAPKVRRAQSGRRQLTDAGLRSVLDVEIGETRRVTARHDERLSLTP